MKIQTNKREYTVVEEYIYSVCLDNGTTFKIGDLFDIYFGRHKITKFIKIENKIQVVGSHVHGYGHVQWPIEEIKKVNDKQRKT